jgi:hypothetical protein
VACRHEQILMPVVDAVAEKLWKNGSRWFVHKHYNQMYPMVSQLELALDLESA